MLYCIKHLAILITVSLMITVQPGGVMVEAGGSRCVTRNVAGSNLGRSAFT